MISSSALDRGSPSDRPTGLPGRAGTRTCDASTQGDEAQSTWLTSMPCRAADPAGDRRRSRQHGGVLQARLGGGVAPRSAPPERQGLTGAYGAGRATAAAATALGLLRAVALVRVVVAEPTLHVLGKAPDFFLFRRAGLTEILILVLAVTVLPGARPVAGRAGRRPCRRAGPPARAPADDPRPAGGARPRGRKNLTSVRGAGLVAIGVVGGLAGGLLYATGTASSCGCATWPRRRWSSPWRPARVAGVQAGAAPAGRHRRRQLARRAHQPRAPGGDVLLDEFPLTSLLDSKGQVDARLYPNFASWPGHSTWYRNATVVSGLTAWAVPALLSGRYPTGRDGGLPDRRPVPRQPVHPARAGPTTSSSPRSSPALPGPGVQGDQGLGPVGAGLKTTLRDSARVFKRIVLAPRRRREPDRSLAHRRPGGRGRVGRQPGRPRSPILKEIEQGNEPRQNYNFVQSIQGTDKPTFYFLHLAAPPPALEVPARRPQVHRPGRRPQRQRLDLRALAAAAVAPAPPTADRRDRPADRPGHAAAR